MPRVLFVCLGNICRSPTGEGVFRSYLAEHGLDGEIGVDSAGTGAWHVGETADPRMRASAETRGYRLDSIARQVVPQELVEWDLVVAMDQSNLRQLKRLDGGAGASIHLLSEFLPPGSPRDVPGSLLRRWRRLRSGDRSHRVGLPVDRRPSAGGVMEAALRRAVESSLTEAEGTAATIVGQRAVGGGCIHQAELLDLADGRSLFIKHNRGVPPEMFPAEAAGLEALAVPGVIRIPRRVAVGEVGGHHFLVMEAIPEGRSHEGFQAEFGRRFAELHRATVGERFGFDHDNFIGSTPQSNGWMDDWVEFWRARRLGFQLDLARRRGLSDRSLDRLGDRLLARLEEWIGLPDEPACLLHGDLWSGNYLVDEAGDAVLIDPAVYRGHREADLAMTMLFGGFGADFHAAYREVWPLPPGSAERLEIYKLYHLLNHLNLFGGSYRSSCVDILRQLVG